MLKVLLTIGGLQLATMAVLLVRTKILAVFIGPEGVGLMAVVDKLLALIVQGASFSLPFAALRFLPELWARDLAACYKAFRAMAFTLGALALVAMLLGALITLAAPWLLGSQLAAHPELLFAAFMSVPAQVFVPFIVNAFAGIMRHRASMIFGLTHAGLQVGAGLIGALLGNLTYLYLAYAGAAAALVGLALGRLAAAMRPTPPPPLEGWRSALPPARMLHFSFALFTLSLAAPYAALYAHYAVLSDLGVAAAGWMQAAIGISLAVRGLLGTAHQVYLTPELNKGGSWQDRMHRAVRFQNMWCMLAAILVPPLLLLADVAVTLLYARSFAPATRFVHWFVMVEIITMLAGTYQAIIVAADRLRFHVVQNAVAQLLFLATAWATIPRWGIVGAALGALIGQLFLFCATSAYLAIKMGLRPPWRTTILTAYLICALTVTGQLGADSTAFTDRKSVV